MMLPQASSGLYKISEGSRYAADMTCTICDYPLYYNRTTQPNENGGIWDL